MPFAEVCGFFFRFETVGWLNTVFHAYVSFTFSSKNLDPLVAKHGSKQVNNTNFHFLTRKAHAQHELSWVVDKCVTRSMGCKLYANEIRSQLTFLLLSIFNRN